MVKNPPYREKSDAAAIKFEPIALQRRRRRYGSTRAMEEDDSDDDNLAVL